MRLVAAYSVYVWLVLWSCCRDTYSNAGTVNRKALIVKRQATQIEAGKISTEFGVAFVEMFGEGGFNVKSLIGVTKKLSPLLSVAGPVFSVLGALTEPSLADIKDLMVKNFDEIKQQLNGAHKKLNEIIDLVQQASEFNKIEDERSRLNSIHAAIIDFNKHQEPTTIKALKKYCQDTANSPSVILQRLNEYVHHDSFPPFLKKTTFDYSKGSSSKLAIVTKYILADAVRASLYKQTCLGNNNATQALKDTKSKEDTQTIQNIATTFLQWEESLAPNYGMDDLQKFSQAHLQQTLQSFVRETHDGWKEAPNLYLEYIGRDLIRELKRKYYPEHPVSFSVAIFASDPNNKIQIFNPHRAAVVQVGSKNSTTGAQYKDTAVITWVGFKEEDQTVKDRLTNAKNRFQQLFKPIDQGKWLNKKAYQCFQNEKAVADAANGRYDVNILNADAAAVASLAKGVVVGEAHDNVESIYFGYSCAANKQQSTKEESATVMILL